MVQHELVGLMENIEIHVLHGESCFAENISNNPRHHPEGEIEDLRTIHANERIGSRMPATTTFHHEKLSA